jgi:stearoyl-CoA desaturase (delta-9 desaturase)
LYDGHSSCFVLLLGHHDYHHEFAWDYRHGIGRFDYDPTKWCIQLWAYLGLAWNLKTAPIERINRSRADTMRLEIEQLKPMMKNELESPKLPILTLSDMDKAVKQGKQWLIIDNYVVDCSKFLCSGPLVHPGGSEILRAYIGKDCSQAFHQTKNQHTQSAQKLMRTLAVGKIQKIVKDNPIE